MIELLHQQGNKFKQLFLIQFHTFFLNSNVMRFTKDQIDGICKDIRYPNEFFLDLIFDEDQSSNISIYEEDVSKWKNVLSDFLMKSFKSKTLVNTNNVVINSNLKKKENEKKLLDSVYKENDAINKENLDSNSNSSNEKNEKEDDFNLLKSNTMDKAKNVLEKFSKDKKKNEKDEEEDEDEEDEDIEKYLKNLENKKK